MKFILSPLLENISIAVSNLCIHPTWLVKKHQQVSVARYAKV